MFMVRDYMGSMHVIHCTVEWEIRYNFLDKFRKRLYVDTACSSVSKLDRNPKSSMLGESSESQMDLSRQTVY